MSCPPPLRRIGVLDGSVAVGDQDRIGTVFHRKGELAQGIRNGHVFDGDGRLGSQLRDELCLRFAGARRLPVVDGKDPEHVTVAGANGLRPAGREVGACHEILRSAGPGREVSTEARSEQSRASSRPAPGGRQNTAAEG